MNIEKIPAKLQVVQVKSQVEAARLKLVQGLSKESSI